MTFDGRIERFNFLLLAHYLLNIKDIKDIPRRNVPISFFVLPQDIENSFAQNVIFLQNRKINNCFLLALSLEDAVNHVIYKIMYYRHFLTSDGPFWIKINDLLVDFTWII